MLYTKFYASSQSSFLPRRKISFSTQLMGSEENYTYLKEKNLRFTMLMLIMYNDI
jgi:hypothetical protein